ncbi:Succinylglutamate desuccinylase / Aspartoacylase family protein [Tepidimonas alkaliphilus]|uniref:Succinylglutamate desuccinylase / Aspartoacylase family protein n=1 Tax=Tepidimonas alkaliphilus TaxID=2588942 RepID=A0A554WDP2_9BURK|nr:succinylglutamate desuccinylase/aspartoacylase family protein [Tepidimonas alkaliphilus]TSE21700.1 Succinylglutamate desuccinylase / Aspartoacylase family protein [Tepidimonas alkaliphilus]
MRLEHHPLPCSSLGTQRHVTSLHFGAAGARPKVYVQASLHADELPGMLVAHHLRRRLLEAESAGALRGEVVLVPAANPIGLAQRLDHRSMGRFELGTSENFNRHYPDLAALAWARVGPTLGPDADANVQRVRAAVLQALAEQPAATELQGLRLTLMRLAADADVVLDLHCDSEAVLHLYSETACWPQLAPLAAWLGAETVLVADYGAGGQPFDEQLSGLWSQLAARLQAEGRDAPLPQACASATVELRGEADVDHALAARDAEALVRYLQHLGVLAGDPGAPPPLRCTPTPLAGTEILRAPHPGVIVFLTPVGARLRPGEAVAEIIDPITGRVTTLASAHGGTLYARSRERYAVAGLEVAKVAGVRPIRSGDLLSA